MIDKSKLLDGHGKPLTQSLFLEIGYTDFSVYTLKDIDYTYNGEVYPSLKRLYLEMEDPTEYEFASTHLLGWKHWRRLCENKQIAAHIEEWRTELEYKLRSKAVRMMLSSAHGGNYQAAKWFADRGWATRGAGRPSKEEVDKNKAIEGRIADEYNEDVVRLFQQRQ
jgi:hypothetical protein